MFIKFLRWVKAKSIRRGASMGECSMHIQIDVSEMGATKKRAISYIKDCAEMGLISLDPTTGRFKITQKGKDWLKTKV